MSPNLVGVAGDWHMNTQWAVRQIGRVAEAGAKKLIQVGDLGLWPGRDGIEYLDAVNFAARNRNIIVYVVRGNHDSNYFEHVLWSDFYPECRITGGKHVRSNIVLLPRTGIFAFGSGEHERTLAVAGGAASIDRKLRSPGLSWWPEELLTDEEVDDFPEGQVDVLVTHDCSDNTPFNMSLVIDPESELNRRRIDRILSKCVPTMHFHGHMHKWYDWCNMVPDSYGCGHYVQTYGLDMDGSYHATGILDLEKMEFNLLTT